MDKKELLEYEKYNSRPYWVRCTSQNFACPYVYLNKHLTIGNVIYLTDMSGETGVTKDEDWVQRIVAYSKKSYKYINSGYTKFVVYKDPIERFNKYCKTKQVPAAAAVELLKKWVFNDGSCKDLHLRDLSSFFKEIQVDYIVKEENVNAFLQQVLGIDASLIEDVPEPEYEVDMTLTQEERQFINDYYSNDYELLSSSKLWYPQA